MGINDLNSMMQIAQGLSNNAVFAAILSATLVGMVTYFANRRIEDYKAKIQIQQQRRQAYSQLRGLKCTLSQVYTTRWESFIYAICDNQLSRLTDDPSECTKYNKEAEEWKRKSDDFVMEMAKNDQRLWELIGYIETIFTHTHELEEYIKALENYTESFEQEFGVKGPSEDDALGDEEVRDTEELWNACDMMIDNVIKFTNEKIEVPIDNLLKYLKSEIEASEERSV